MVKVVKPKNTAKPELVQEGIHSATLTNVTAFSNAYGERIGFEFTLEDDSKVMRSTNTALTARSKLTEVIQGLMGRALTSKELEAGVDLDELIGTECQVLVTNSASKNGAVYSNVEKIFNAVQKSA
jgi:hypothetical protein